MPKMGPKMGGGMSEEAGEGDALDVPTQDMMDALKTGDTERFKAGFRAAMSACMDEESSEGEYEAKE